MDFSFDNDQAWAESPSSIPDRSMLQSSSSSSDGSSLTSSSVAPRPAVRNSISSSMRPKTTERLDKILEKDLQIYGSSLDAKPPTPAPKKIPNQRYFVGHPIASDEDDIDFGAPLQVGQYSESRDRATILDNVSRTSRDKIHDTNVSRASKSSRDRMLDSIKKDVEDVRATLMNNLKSKDETPPPVVPSRRAPVQTPRTSKIDDLLSQEQDALSMSLSQVRYGYISNSSGRISFSGQVSST